MQHTVICGNCGNSVTLPEGRESGFCSRCGTKLDISEAASGNAQRAPEPGTSVPEPSYVPEQPATAASAANAVFTPPVMPKKGPPKLIIGIAAAAVVVVVAAVVGITTLAGSSYKKAEAEFLKTLFSAAPVSNSSGKFEFSLGYVPSDQMHEEMDITDLSFGGTVNYTESAASGEFSIMSDNSLVTDLGFSFNGEELTLSLPQLTEYYLRFPIATDDEQNIDLSKLDRKKLENSLNNVIKAYFKYTDDITQVEKGVELTSGGITVKCTSYTLDFNETVLAQIALAALEELRNNSNLMDIICDYYVSMGGDEDDFFDSLDDAKYELEDLDGTKRLFRMTVWADGNKIIGRKIDRVQGSDFVFSYQNLEKGGKLRSDARLSLDDYSVTLTGEFEKSGGAWNGTLRLTGEGGYYDNELFSVRVKCTDIKRSGKQMTGKLNVSGTIEDVSIDLDLTLEKRDNSQYIKAEGDFRDYYGDKYEIGTLTLTYSHDSGGKVTITENNEAYGVIVGDYSRSNGRRAFEMAAELEDLWYSGDLEENEMLDELLYLLWDYVDDIVWYSDYS